MSRVYLTRTSGRASQRPGRSPSLTEPASHQRTEVTSSWGLEAGSRKKCMQLAACRHRAGLQKQNVTLTGSEGGREQQEVRPQQGRDVAVWLGCHRTNKWANTCRAPVEAVSSTELPESRRRGRGPSSPPDAATVHAAVSSDESTVAVGGVQAR